MRASLSLEGAHTFSARRSGVTSRHAFRLFRFHGKGSMRYANGSKYIGQFENGLPHGIGAIHDPVSGNSYRYIQVGETSPCLDRRFAIQVVTHLYSPAFPCAFAGVSGRMGVSTAKAQARLETEENTWAPGFVANAAELGSLWIPTVRTLSHSMIAGCGMSQMLRPWLTHSRKRVRRCLGKRRKMWPRTDDVRSWGRLCWSLEAQSTARKSEARIFVLFFMG
jgi:MORN repeat